MSQPAIDGPAPPGGGPPRVVLLTSPSLFGAEIINRLADDPGLNLVGVGLTDRIYKGKGAISGAWTFLQRTGWPYVWYNVLHSPVAWARLRASGRPAGLNQVPGGGRRLRDVNAPETIAWLKSLSPDYVASFFFNQWIGPDVRTVPRRRCVNLHPSLLPALRGPDPIFRTLERGLATTGCTIHEVADAIDAGAILFQKAVLVPEQATAFGLYLKMVREGADLLAAWLAGRLESTTAPDTPGDSGDYRTFPRPEEVQAFLRAGRRLISSSELRRALVQVK